jgi:hypothetical protein
VIRVCSIATRFVMPREVLDRQAVRAVMTNLPPRRRGSSLDPYLPLIRALRRRGRPYRDIVGVLREQCGVRVGLHTLFHFVRTRMPRPTTAPVDRPSTHRAHTPSPPRHAPPTPTKTEPDDPGVHARIAALKQGATRAAPTKEFQYDETEPLRLTTDRPTTRR